MKRILTMLGLTGILAGCGGGGGGSSSTVVPNSTGPIVTTTPDPGNGSTGPTAQTRVTITIPTPTTSSTSRSPRYVSSATNSLSIATTAGTSVVGLGASSPNCTAASGGRNCTISVQFPPGTNVPFTARTFASADGSGTPLSITVASTTIVANTTNTLNLTLNAVVNALQVAISPASFTSGQAGTASVTTTVLDAANQIIVVGSNNLVDQNNSPVTVTLADSDASGITSVSPTAVGPVPATLSYTGGTPPAGATISATARNAPSAVIASANAALAFTAPPTPVPTAVPTATPVPTAIPTATPVPTAVPTATPVPTPVPTAVPTATPSPSPTPVPAIVANPNSLTFQNSGAAYAQTVSLSQGSFRGAFTAVTSTANTSAVTLSISGQTLTVTPQQAGGTNIIVTGASGATLTIPVSVTLTQLTINGQHR